MGLPAFVIRRATLEALLVLAVSSAALVLIEVAPGDPVSGFDLTAESMAAERARLGLDRPFLVRYVEWLGRAVRLDLGESLKYQRPVRDLLAERAGNTALLGGAALMLGTLIGIPAGIYTGSRRGPVAAAIRSLSMLSMSIPPLVSSFLLLLFASYTRVLPVGGFGAMTTGEGALGDLFRYLVLPCLALSLPLVASLEHLQSQAMRDALSEPSVRAALARGCSRTRVVWRHAMRLSLKPVIALYGVFAGSVLSGSFVVEIVMSWPGLGALTYEALVARDLYLVAGCAAAGATFLAAGVFAADVALAIVDPRIREAA